MQRSSWWGPRGEEQRIRGPRPSNRPEWEQTPSLPDKCSWLCGRSVKFYSQICADDWASCAVSYIPKQTLQELNSHPLRIWVTGPALTLMFMHLNMCKHYARGDAKQSNKAPPPNPHPVCRVVCMNVTLINAGEISSFTGQIKRLHCNQTLIWDSNYDLSPASESVC